MPNESAQQFEPAAKVYGDIAIPIRGWRCHSLSGSLDVVPREWGSRQDSDLVGEGQGAVRVLIWKGWEVWAVWEAWAAWEV